MKLSTDAHSEIEGDAAHGNVLCNSASDSLTATDEVAAGNDESVATEGDDVEIPRDTNNSTPVRLLDKPGQNPVQNGAEPAAEESELESQRQTPVQKQQQQRVSMVNSKCNNGAIYPAVCRPYANISAFVCAPVCAALGKRDLINLQSALSPKYIGYANANSPTPLSDSDDTIRTTRRRVNQAAALNNSSAGETLAHDNASPRTPGGGGGGGGDDSANQLLSKTYMSPIEKLLIKNGASSPNSTGFEAGSEDLGIRPIVRKHVKRKMKRVPKAKVTLELDEKNQQEVDEKSVKTEPIDEEVDRTDEAPTQEAQTTAISIKAETEAEHKTAVDVHINQEDTIRLDIVNNPVESTSMVITEEPKDLEKSTEELAFALPLASSTEVDLKSPPDLSSTALATSIKSPSSVSIDSAKGLSIVTDPGWPTYQVGDLFWGKVFSYCFWPCMVCPDPLGQIVGNMPSHPQRSSLDNANVPIQVHVRFFDDNGRRNWIKPENLLTFAGLKAFDDMREELRIKHGPKSAKYRQMVPKRTKVVIWRQAIEEAQAMTQIPYSDRLEKFYQTYENVV